MRKLLLIDDEEGIRTVWKRFHDYAEPVFRGQLEMEVAGSLDQGLDKMLSTQYDAVLLDLTLPPMAKEDVIAWIKENHAKMPPIIVLTGAEDVAVRRQCMIAGAASFWTKLDAQEKPDLFFKSVYNRYLARYASEKAQP